MKAAKRKRAAAAPARTTAVPDVAAKAAAPAEPVPPVIEDAAAEAILAAPPPAAAPVAEAASASVPAAAAGPVVVLNSNCTVKDAAALKQALCAVVGSEAPVTLDVSSVERIDTAAVQLLCAFVKQRMADARGVAWSAVPATLKEAAELLGVRHMLMLPAEGAAS